MERTREEAKLELDKLREQSRLQEERDANQAKRDYFYKSLLQQEAYDLQAVGSEEGAKKYTDGDMKATDMEDVYYGLIESGKYTEEQAIDYLLNQAKGVGERIIFLSNLGKDPKEYGVGTSQTNSEGLTPQDLKKAYPNLSETARSIITSSDVKDKLKAFYDKGDNTIEDFKNLIIGMKAESDEATFVGDVLDDFIINNQFQGFNKTLGSITDNFGADSTKTNNALKQSLALIDGIVVALKEAGIDSEPTSTKETSQNNTLIRSSEPAYRRGKQATSFEYENKEANNDAIDLNSLRANYAMSMYVNLIDRVADKNDIDVTFTNFNDIPSDSKARIGKTIIEHLNTVKDEDINEVKPMIVSYVQEKLIAPEERRNEAIKQKEATIEQNFRKIKAETGKKVFSAFEIAEMRKRAEEMSK